MGSATKQRVADHALVLTTLSSHVMIETTLEGHATISPNCDGVEKGRRKESKRLIESQHVTVLTALILNAGLWSRQSTRRERVQREKLSSPTPSFPSHHHHHHPLKLQGKIKRAALEARSSPQPLATHTHTLSSKAFVKTREAGRLCGPRSNGCPYGSLLRRLCRRL